MSSIRLTQTTTLTPAECVDGSTDFGPGHSKLFTNSADDYLKIHQLGTTDADITEGTGGLSQRLHYDWSNFDRVVLNTTDSNTWSNASGYTYTFRSQPGGKTAVDVVIIPRALQEDSQITGGIGLFAHASGVFTGTISPQGLLAQNPDGSCDANKPLLREVDQVKFSGTLSF